MSLELELTQQKTAECMDKILKCFKPGAKILVAVRREGKPEQDFVMTNDDLEQMEALLVRCQGKST